MKITIGLFSLLLLCASLATAEPVTLPLSYAQTAASSGEVLVTTAVDENDPPGGTVGTGLSLREAIALTTNGACIRFSPTLDGATITLNSELSFEKNLTVDATTLPLGITLSGNQLTSLIAIRGGTTVSILHMAFTEGGGYPSPFSGAIFVDEGTLALTRCKIHSNTVIRAVYNDGFLTLSQCEVQNNTWTQDGAGIYNETAAELHLIQSCLSGNSAGNEGGALYNRPDAIATLVYCTLTGNYADDHGGAILNHGQLNVTHCTISENTGGLTGVGGLLNAIDGTVTLNYSITTGNLGGNVGGPGILSGSHNITTGMPFLSPLGSFGGPTQTMALLPISLALNGATGSNATADQRGLPIIGTPDIGAYEAGHFNSYQTWIWESLPSPSNYTLADRLHAASFDYDGDGQSNGDEWNALTNPANGSRFFAPTSQLIGQTILIRFPSAAGRSYRLDHSETLAPGSWMHSNQQIILGDGNEKTFSTLTPTSARRFFRVVPH